MNELRFHELCSPRRFLAERVVRRGAPSGPGRLENMVGPPRAVVPLPHDPITAPLEPVRDPADLLLVLVDGVEVRETTLGALAAIDLHAVDLMDLRLLLGRAGLCGNAGHVSVLPR